MKAVVITEDKKLRYADVPNPTLADGQVLVKVHAAAVNRADLMQVDGCYPPPPGHRLGREFNVLELEDISYSSIKDAIKHNSHKCCHMTCTYLSRE